MRFKVLVAVVCAMIMVVCPLMPAALDSEGAEDFDTTAFVKVSSLSKEKADALFGGEVIENEVLSSIIGPLYLNSNLKSNSTYTLEMSDVVLEEGKKYTCNSDFTKATTSSFYKVSCTFSFKFTITKEIPLLYEYGNSYEGDGMTELVKKFGQTNLKVNDVVQLSGTFLKENVFESELNDIFHTVQSKYYPEKESRTEVQKIVQDVKVRVNDYSYTDKYEVRSEMKSSMTYEFVNGDKSDYQAGMKECASGSASMKSTSSGTRTMGEKDYGYKYMNPYGDLEYKVEHQAVTGPSAINTDAVVNYTSLSHFYHYANDDAVRKAVSECNGTCSRDANKYNETCNAIKSDIGTISNNGSSDNTMTVIAIVVTVIVILVLIGLWYFKFRPESTGAKTVKSEPVAKSEESDQTENK